MARKRKESLEGQIHVDLQPEELLQLKNICIIRMESNLEGFCRKLILEGLKREATDILSSVAMSYRLEQAKVPLGDQETDPSSSRKARDACGPVCDPDWTSTTAPTQAAFRLKRNPKLPYQGEPFPDELDPPDLDDKGLRGGEADEESLQKPQGTERANMQSALQGLIAAVPDQPQTNPTSVRPQGSKNTIA